MQIISLDIGKIRTGYAFGDTTLGVATTRTKILATTDILRFLETELHTGVELVLIGYPKNRLSGNTEITDFVENCIANIKNRFSSLKIQLIDERLTSKIASQNLRENLRSNKNTKVKNYLDNESARIILQEWLDEKY
jgi:putative holliday junction resolvase